MHIPHRLPNRGLEVSRFILQVNNIINHLRIAEAYIPKYRGFAMDIMQLSNNKQRPNMGMNHFKRFFTCIRTMNFQSRTTEKQKQRRHQRTQFMGGRIRINRKMNRKQEKQGTAGFKTHQYVTCRKKQLNLLIPGKCQDAGEVSLQPHTFAIRF